MRHKKSSIPVNTWEEEFATGITIKKMSSNSVPLPEGAHNFHRHNFHAFVLLEKGSASGEIDFEKHTIHQPAVMYIHPDQVHRALKPGKAVFYMLGITQENIHPKYLPLLEQITPARPLILKKDVVPIILRNITLCLNIFERKHEKLYTSLLNDCCNTLIGLIISQYLAQSASTDGHSRFHMITKSFRLLLERDFMLVKRPSAYANALNISTHYLNECVNHVTGNSVSHHIQQRVILEAKRLIYHSDKSFKEIATELGYDEYAYFSRLFTKVTGMTAAAFRKKNHD
jgi:AraC-like DNA-binding protein